MSISKNKTRKRGIRKKQPGKRHRDLIKEANAARALQASLQEETEDEILSSVESEISKGEDREPECWQSLEEELRDLQDEEEHNLQDEMREVTWSPSPEPGLNIAEPQIANNEQDETVQPYGEYCIVICRISSPKMEKKSKVNITNDQRREAHYERRRQEGLTLARRLAANCPAPVTFRGVVATCHKRQATISTNWQSRVEPRSAMEKDIGGWFRGPNMRGKKVTVLIRGISGVTCDVGSFQSFLEMIKQSGVKAQLIFQYNKIFDAIDPHCLRNFKGLGGTVDIMAADFLEHLETRQNIPLVARILEIWKDVTTNTGNQQGIQDRNSLLSHHATEPERDGAAGRIRA